MPNPIVSIIGLGYIGLPTAAAIATRRIRVIGVDTNPEVVETINRGDIHVVEPDLDVAVHGAVTAGYLQATTTPRAADAFLIAVPTPLTVDGEPDTTCIESSVRALATVLEPGNTVILESTAPVGTTEQVCRWLGEQRRDLRLPDTSGVAADIHVAYCPERVLPGKILRELVANDRVIGGMTEDCAAAAHAIYRLFVDGELIHTDVRSAEMCKLTENAFRDVNIAFANELSLVCDRYGIDPWQLINLANRHPRVNILQPGAGVGGHCIAVDPWFLIADNGDCTSLMRAARQVNDGKPRYIVQQVQRYLADRPDGVIACLGLAFKPDVDDLRESPAVRIVAELAREHNARICVVEPHIDRLPLALRRYANVELVDFDAACRMADVVVGLVRHRDFVARLQAPGAVHGRMLDFVNLRPETALGADERRS